MPQAPQPASAMYALVTGFPGNLSRPLVRSLLHTETTQVTAVVQEHQMESARRFRNGLAKGKRTRLTLLVGDVARLDLGLAGDEVNTLSASATHVFHLAALQYLGMDEAEMARVNIDGTANVLELCRTMEKLERLSHFSTCFVSGDRDGVITEDELTEGQQFRNGYERTKFRAELLVRAARDLPVTVFRPGIVVGDSRTGKIDRFDGVYGLGILFATSPSSIPMPLPGAGRAPLNLVPVDFVVAAAIALSQDPRGIGTTYHLVDPAPLSSSHLYKLIADRAGRKLPRLTVNYQLAKRVLRLPVLERFTRPQVQALDYLNHLAIYNCSHTLTHLEGTGILCPRVDTYLPQLIRYASRAVASEKRRKARTGRA